MSTVPDPLQYRIPASLKGEIDDLERHIAAYRDGLIVEAQLKAQRVPFGIYEQRVKGLYMARIRCAAGIISLPQLRAAAEFAAAFGSGKLHITTRQELQIHDVPLPNLIPLLRELANVNLSSRGGGGNTVRNITASWDAGIAPNEPFDVTPYALELTSRLVALPDSWLLPRKFKIAFSNGVSDNAFATVNDVGFIATTRDAHRGFKVFVAGGMGRSPRPGMVLHDFIGEEEVFIVAEAVKRLFSHYGNRRNKHAARLRFLLETLGEQGFDEHYNSEREKLVAENVAPFVIRAIQQSWPDITTPPVTVTDRVSFQRWQKRYAARQRQPGLFTIRIPVFLGNLTAAQAVRLADDLLPFGNDCLRLTQDQNIVVGNIPETHLGTLFSISNLTSPLSAEPVLFGNGVACAGASTCQLGICRSRDALGAVIDHLRIAGIDLDALGHFRMHISGCNNSCGQHAIADLGFAGKTAGADDKRRYPAYTVFAGAALDARNGTRLARKAGEIPARDLPVFVHRLLDHYLSRQLSFGSFSEYLTSDGFAHIGTLCAGFPPVPSYEKAPRYFRDFGDTTDFNLDGRGAGECASGVFDLIDIDIARLRSLRKELASIPPGGENSPESWFELASVSARALLVTRGIEADGDAVFAEFRRGFIESGLVPERFLALINALDEDGIAGFYNELEIADLADAVESLYATLDETLQFHQHSSAVTAPGAVPDARKDLRGVACPMNFIKTKAALAALSGGKALEILLDDGAPIDNVPRSVEAEGHKIITREKTGDFWTVVIRKER